MIRLRLSTMLTLALTLGTALVACAQGNDSLATGDAAYRAGDFARAITEYRSALAAGNDGWTVHYNLGDALYRSGERGEAIAHWLAARRLAPRDPDVRANLDRALTQRPQGPPAPPPSWLHAAVQAVVGRFTLNELAATAMLLSWLTAALVIAVLLQLRPSRSLRRAVLIVGGFALLTTGFAVGRWWSYHHGQTAVVVTETARLHTGPGDDFEAAQSLTEGCILRVTRRQSGWTQVVAEGGVRGWMADSAAVTVSPDASAGGPASDE